MRSLRKKTLSSKARRYVAPSTELIATFDDRNAQLYFVPAETISIQLCAKKYV